MQKKILLSWSGGKDSAMSLYRLRLAGEYEVAALLTTVSENYNRISMHGVRRSLLRQQAESIGINLEEVSLPKDLTNEDYEHLMTEVLTRSNKQGIDVVAFGDIFLEDLKKYREENLGKLDMRGLFPVWGEDPMELAHSFINLGFKAILTCVDTQILDASFAGRAFDEQLMADLPSEVDACGENGAFHTFVYDGPIFSQPINWEIGEKVLRESRFQYCDLLPVNDPMD